MNKKIIQSAIKELKREIHLENKIQGKRDGIIPKSKLNTLSMSAE